jgi:hypothetical protein
MRNKELKESYIDERTGIEYRLVGDYYLPNITLPKPRRTGNIGKYGRLRLKYLEEHHKAELILMRVNNELTSHLLDIEDECKERVEQLVKQMSEKENVTEELKVNNQMLWVQSINNIKNRAEEIAFNEIIYK